MNKQVSIFLKNYWILILIFSLASLVRFYNFPDRITFGPEQAISLLVSGDYINEKFSLLGLPNVQRTTSLGYILYSPSLFNYSLVPIMMLFNYNPTLITSYFTFLNLFTGVALFIVVRKIFNVKIALFSTTIFLFNDLMVFHSMFIWIVNYLPLTSIITVYLYYKFYKARKSRILPFLIGLLLSISFGLEYIFFFTALFLFGILIYLAHKRVKAFLFFISGAVLGNLSTIIFDLTHDFYHLRTLWQYFIDTLFNPSQSLISYYHFFQFWPVFAVALGYLLSKIYRISKMFSVGLLVLYIAWNLLSANVSFVRPTGMFQGLNISRIERAAKIIANDHPKDFNVVMTFDFDSRAHPLRYLIKYIYGYKALGVEDYPNAKNLYIFTTEDYPVLNSGLWEIASFQGEKSEILGRIDNFVVYKLSKGN